MDVAKYSLLLSITILMQYGPIVDIDLKIPPRPPGYAFVEVCISPIMHNVGCVVSLVV